MPFVKTMEELLSVNRIVFFITLCAGTLLVLFVKKTFIENETVAFMILEQRGEMGAVHFVNGLQYFSIPLFYSYKFTLTGLLLWIASFMFGYKVNYRSAWAIAMMGELLFLVPELIKLFWFLLVARDPDIFDIRAFYPLSLLTLFDPNELADKWHYPLKALNLFEVLYWYLLIAGIHISEGKKYRTAQLIVFTGYIFFFLLWLLFYVLVYK